MKFYVKFLEQIGVNQIIYYLKKYDIIIDRSTSIDEVIFQVKARGVLDEIRKSVKLLGDLLYFVEHVQSAIGYGTVGLRVLKDPVIVVYGRVTWFRPGVVSERLFTSVSGSYYFVYNKDVTDLGFGPAYHGFLTTLKWGAVVHQDSCARLVSLHEKPFLKIDRSILGKIHVMQWRMGTEPDILHSQEPLLGVMSSSDKLRKVPSQAITDNIVRIINNVGASVTISEQPDQDRCYKMFPVAKIYRPVAKEPSTLDVWKEIARLLRGG